MVDNAIYMHIGSVYAPESDRIVITPLRENVTNAIRAEAQQSIDVAAPSRGARRKRTT